MAEECLAKHGGSATAFSNALIAERVFAGETMPDDMFVKSKAFMDVMRKAVQEYMNKEMVFFKQFLELLNA